MEGMGNPGKSSSSFSSGSDEDSDSHQVTPDSSSAGDDNTSSHDHQQVSEAPQRAPRRRLKVWYPDVVDPFWDSEYDPYEDCTDNSSADGDDAANQDLHQAPHDLHQTP